MSNNAYKFGKFIDNNTQAVQLETLKTEQDAKNMLVAAQQNNAKEPANTTAAKGQAATCRMV